MTTEQYLAELVKNFLAQWNADLTKKPSYTLAQAYLLLIAQVNASHAEGVWPTNIECTPAGETVQGYVSFYGYPTLEALIGAELTAGHWDEWPIVPPT